MQHEGLAPGTVVAGKYVVERALGRGGMGAVYVVSHATTGKRMAMKCLLAELVSNADLVSRFLREAQVMGRLQHRHVVDVFDVGRDGDVLYIVMALLEGKPLSELLHDSSLTLEEALVILLRAMEGVAAAHAQGIVHRDLKPDNIFVCVGASGRLDDPRVLDFGISKLEDTLHEPLTRTGTAMGTPYYMSIEQLRGQRDIDARVDVYALGVILYEAIAGEVPYRADSVSALAIKVLTTEAVPLGRLRPDLPSGLAEVVMKALSRERDDRQRSVRQLIEALRPFVPRSAGLLVPEGEGRPLRTPRASREPGLYAQSPLPAPVDARQTATGTAFEAADRPQNLRAWWPARVAWALALLALASAGAWFALQPRGALPVAASTPALPAVLQHQASPASEPGSRPPRELGSANGASDGLAPSTHAHEAPVHAESADAPPVTPASSPNARAASQRLAAPASAPDASAPAPASGLAASAHKPRATRRSGETSPTGRAAKSAAAAASQRAESVREPRAEPPAAATTAPSTLAPRKSAEGRAGKLGSDEF